MNQPRDDLPASLESHIARDALLARVIAYYPIALELSDRPVLVVGVGAVGRRKAEGLVATGARVLAVDPGPVEPPSGVTFVRKAYRLDHLIGVVLAFAAATPEVNRQVVADARSVGIWVNSATEPEMGDFLVPASWRDGPVGLSVSTSGASRLWLLRFAIGRLGRLGLVLRSWLGF